MGQLEANMGRRAVQLRKVFADLGPSFIKVGPALSARPDLLPQVYLEVRQQLHNPYSWLVAIRESKLHAVVLARR